MGVKPNQVADLLALKGDSIDNIPGAPGIGDKGANDLILRFGSVEGALEHAAEVERKMYRESLQNNREQILLSKRLATIDATCRWSLRSHESGGAGARRRGADARSIRRWSFRACCAKLGRRKLAHARLREHCDARRG